MFIVYLTEEGTDYKVFKADNMSADEITNKVGGISWYGATANTEESAIKQAKAAGLKFTLVEKQTALLERLRALEARSAALEDQTVDGGAVVLGESWNEYLKNSQADS